MARRVGWLVFTLSLAIAVGVGATACSVLRGARPTPALTPTQTLTPAPPPPTATPSPGQILQAAERAYAYGSWEQAASLAQAVLEQFPSLAEPARLLLARSRLALGAPDEAIGLLEGAVFSDAGRQQNAVYTLASAYRDKGDWQKVIEKQTELLSVLPILSDWIHELNGDACVQLGQPDKAVEEYRLALAASPEGERAGLLEKIADMQAKAKQTDEALKTYAELLALAPTPEFAAKVHYLTGLALRQAGNEAAALDSFAKAVEAATGARESYLALVELVNADKMVDEFRRGLIDYQNGAHQAAIQAFDRYLGGSKTPQAADALYYSGQSYLALGQHDKALETLERAFAETADLTFQAKILMARARVLQKAGRSDEAHATYRRAQSLCPVCAAAPEALWRSAEVAFAQGDRAGAAADFLWLQRNYPQDDGADDAMLRAALLYYADVRYAEAVQVCEELLSRYAKSDLTNAAHFWAAKALLQSQRQSGAETHLRAAATSASQDYYSFRAAAILQGDTALAPLPGNVLLEGASEQERAECQSWLAGWANKGEPYDFAKLPDDVTNDSDYRKGEAFAALGLADEAAERFGMVRARWKDAPLPLFQLAERLRDLGLYRQSIACAERVIALSPESSVFSVPRYLQRLAYPIYYPDLVLEHAGDNGLEPLLVFSLIRQESRFDPLAGSWAGALGLMQVTPPTGEWVALQLGIRDFRKEDLLQPSVSLRFGAWYLGRQLRDFSGDVFAALAAYNGGPGYTRLWLSLMIDYDPDLFVESIPVAETQTYVKTILEQHAAYSRLYQPGHSDR